MSPEQVRGSACGPSLGHLLARVSCSTRCSRVEPPFQRDTASGHRSTPILHGGAAASRRCRVRRSQRRYARWYSAAWRSQPDGHVSSPPATLPFDLQTLSANERRDACRCPSVQVASERAAGFANAWRGVLPRQLPSPRSAQCLALGHMRRPPRAELMRFAVTGPEAGTLVNDVSASAISPDGRRLVFTVMDAAGTMRLWIRAARLSHRTAAAGYRRRDLALLVSGQPLRRVLRAGQAAKSPGGRRLPRGDLRCSGWAGRNVEQGRRHPLRAAILGTPAEGCR